MEKPDVIAREVTHGLSDFEHQIKQPPAQFTERARIKSVAEYEALYQESLKDPSAFWGKLATSELQWKDRWTNVVSHDFGVIGKEAKPYVSYFAGGSLNISVNCLDRHIEAGRGKKIALRWQGEPEEESSTVTYQELHQQVCRFAQVLERNGVVPGTRVMIFMPLTPFVVIAMLACARVGATHSVVFSAFSSEALKSRIQDCDASVVITSDCGFHAGKRVGLKEKVDQALTSCPGISRVIVHRRGDGKVEMKPGRDVWWHEEMQAPGITDIHTPKSFASEHPLFILYTSGSTGKPKGVLHTSAGYLLYAHTTFKYFFDIRDDDVFWCTADVGWITGHSYLVYGPLSNGATCVLYEGTPTYPAPDRFWQIVAKNKVSILYTAPTAIRLLMKHGDALPAKHDLSSLRLLGSVGEPINPEAWLWYHRVIGGERCPVIDTWWQTETGGIMVSTLPGAMPMKPGSAGRPFFGVSPQIVKDNGALCAAHESGAVVIDRPWPGMLRGVYGDSKHELIYRTYFSQVPGKYYAGDGARSDDDGYWWFLGRIDDVLNVSAHRISTAELESALVGYIGVTEAAVVGFPHDLKGQAIHCFVVLKNGMTGDDSLANQLRQHIRTIIGPIATPDRIQFAEGLPKTRSGKIMRRVLRKISEGASITDIGDTSTLADPGVVATLIDGMKQFR